MKGFRRRFSGYRFEQRGSSSADVRRSRGAGARAIFDSLMIASKTERGLQPAAWNREPSDDPAAATTKRVMNFCDGAGLFKEREARPGRRTLGVIQDRGGLILKSACVLTIAWSSGKV